MKAGKRKSTRVFAVADSVALVGMASLSVGVGLQFSWSWSLIVAGIVLVSAAVVNGLRSRAPEDVDHDR